MRVLFKATLQDAYKFCVQDPNGHLWILYGDGRLKKLPLETESELREYLTRQGWCVQSVPQA